MKKKRYLSVVLVVAFLLASSSIVAAQSGGVIDCDLDITYNGSFWFGTLTGPKCDVAGFIRFDAVPDEYTYPGKTMHFVEEFTIWPTSGGDLSGKNWGVWNMKTLKFRANGWVTDASPEWDHLVGSHYHEVGVTSDPSVLPITVEEGAWAKITP
jgi:hypothetical protein